MLSAIRCHVLVERRTEGDSTVFRAAVLALWRASPYDLSHSERVDSAEAVRIMAAHAATLDSLRALDRSVFGHGSLYGHSHLSVRRRPGGREMLATLPDSAFLARGAFRVPAQDSTLVLLVDGLERAGYQPAVLGIIYPNGRVIKQVEDWLATLRTDPQIAAFLERTP